MPQGLGRDKIQELTGSVSPEVLEAMRRLIENILTEGARAARAAATSARAAVALRRHPHRPSAAGVGGETFMETSGIKLRELLVWQLITGYTLRELEAKDELNKLL